MKVIEKHQFCIFLFLETLIFLCVNYLYSQNPRLMEAKDCAVMVTATSQIDPPSVTLKWMKNDVVSSYELNRKMKNDNHWSSTFTVTLDSLTDTYTDYDVKLGEAYEYAITAKEYVSILKDTGNVSFYYPVTAYGYGYIYAGVDYEPPVLNSKRVILLIDETIKSALSNEIETLESDIISEGWVLVERVVPRTEKFDANAVLNVKNIIREEYNKDKSTTTIFILGRVAVPYSGELNQKFENSIMSPTDAHPEHCGAWPADVFYGVLMNNDLDWTDTYVRDTNGIRKENWNIPGDGKFDNTLIPKEVSLAVGRVDLYNMPSFGKSEVELIRNYLKKNHEYRTGQIQILNRGLIDDNFGWLNGENPGQNAWRNFPPLIGYDSVREADWFTELPKSSYLWAYGCGSGSISSCGGLNINDSGKSVDGITADFAKNPMNVIFTMLFGSWFGDWDTKDNFMRAALCSDPPALTSCWAGRPSWYFHHLGLGESIGYSLLISQNNNLYIPNRFNINGTIITNQLASGYVHIALMGDPTLTINTEVVQPPKNVTVSQSNHNLNISWEKPEKDVDGYIIYASKYKNGPYHKINSQILTDTCNSFVNYYDGQMFYIVKSVKLQKTFSGSYYKVSPGIMKDIYPADVDEKGIMKNNLFIIPNPAKDFVNLSFTIPVQTKTNIEIYDVVGNKMYKIVSTDLSSGTHQFAWNLNDYNGQRVSAGVYFIKVQTIQKIDIQKIVVIP